jgi:hypothetical protein
MISDLTVSPVTSISGTQTLDLTLNLGAARRAKIELFTFDSLNKHSYFAES